MGNGKSVDSINQMFKDAQTGPLGKNPRFAREVKEVQFYYEFFEGFDVLDMNQDYGQTWKSPKDMDYEPTKEIRNYTKKLISKQARFMTGTPPELIIKAVAKGQEESAEKKRLLLDEVLQRANFWSKMSKALVDSTIGKRVLMMVIANEGEPINVRFYPMPQFDYVSDPNNSNKLLSVDIVYQDERTLGKDVGEQLWHHYSYEMKSSADVSAIATATEETDKKANECWLTYRMTNGNDQQLYVKQAEQGEQPDATKFTTELAKAKVVTTQNSNNEEIDIPMIVRESTPTGFSQIPAYVIKNESLTGDIYGTSDLKDLVPIANNYNRTMSDLRDALKFKMFEQPVITDGDSKSIAGIRIAPNALIDLKTDSKLTMGAGSSKQAQIGTLSSSFNFLGAAQYYLDDAKRAMYEIMDQPLPEKIQEAPSGKAMKFLFYDLMSRCDRKWIEWDDAIVWLIELITEAIAEVPDMYQDLEDELLSSIGTETTESLRHIYPLPEDENEKKQIAINEVNAHVKSIRTYIREYSEEENEQSELDMILEELGLIDEATGGGFNNLVNSTAEGNSDQTTGGGTNEFTKDEEAVATNKETGAAGTKPEE